MTKLTWHQCFDEWGLPGYCTQVGGDLVVTSVVKDVATGKPLLLDLIVVEDAAGRTKHMFTLHEVASAPIASAQNYVRVMFGL